MCHFVPLGPNTFTCARCFLYLAHVNVFESQLEPPVAIVSALVIGRSAAIPTVNFCRCERYLICSFWQPSFEHVAFMHAVLP